MEGSFKILHVIVFWKYEPKYEGDLVAKFCFAKKKIVWEVLVGELKSKIEIQWSDITQLKANCPNDGPSSLSLVVARQPLFFRPTCTCIFFLQLSTDMWMCAQHVHAYSFKSTNGFVGLS
ncbi:hypothetical protein MtrunA17_Chr4g0073591 [Medicago truncatula]|uniref:TRF2/HOY1 PH-like domain-containing protein n=1 Tax=Medicago truncatula TaxID=3880 RepID=A0A396IKG2_MEDTR|nr:hypothetical protein MtrunA17_Chr4g0073591 [Medicago truncatula]